MRARATSKLFAVAGDPIAHSLSPAMHNAAIAALGLDAVYVAARTTPRAFPGLVYSLLEAGGGLNITTPFKDQAAALVDHPTDAVRMTGACNTIWGQPDAPSGDNTDIVGVRRAARRLMESVVVARALIAGTGGAARAAALALHQEWPGVVIEIASRTESKAAAFTGWARGQGISTATAGEIDGRQQLLVNATPLGRGNDGAMVFQWRDTRTIRPALLDLVYAPGETPWVRWGRQQGLRAMDGRVMLVEQGVAAFEHFFGVQPPVEVMRAAVEDGLRA